jgi:hypothetical protein
MPPPNVPLVSRCPTSVSSSVAMTAAAIASMIPSNLAQLLQVAQSLKNTQQASRQHSQQLRSSTSTHSSSLSLSSVGSHHHHHHHHQNHASGNRDVNEVVDMDVESPSPPQISSSTTSGSSNRVSSTTSATATVQTLWDQILKSTQSAAKSSSNMSSNKRIPPALSKIDPKKSRHEHPLSAPTSVNKHHQHHHRSHHQIVNVTDNKKHPLLAGSNANTGNKLDQLTVLDDVPSSAVEMAVKEKVIFEICFVIYI